MKNFDFLDPLNSTQLISMNEDFTEMVDLFNLKKFPRVLLLNGKKGVGKFTLVFHFLNYIFTQNEKNSYDLKTKSINIKSFFYNQLLARTNQDVLFIKAEENKNIKIEEIRDLKKLLSSSTLSKNPRFIVIDEVEFINENSVNALLKPLEEPSINNFFILINNQQAELLKTISSRCIKKNIFLNTNETHKIINLLLENNNIDDLLGDKNNLSPGLFLRFNSIYLKYNISKNENILDRIKKLLVGYKKDKNKILISLCLFLIDQYFLKLIQTNEKRLDFLLSIKSDINKNLNDYIYYNLNINSVLNSIEVKLNNV
jgi:DNA polymerase-3 subunit delta'